jgi:hypothetical protein
MRPFVPILLALAALAPAEDPERISDRESYAVYGTVLALDPRASVVSKVFLRSETRFDTDCITSENLVPTEWRDALANYLRRNRVPDELDGYAKMTVPAQSIYTLWFDDIISKPDEWEFFWGETPSALDVRIGPDDQVLFEVSAVGFDEPRQHAIVYLAHHAGGDSGVGTVWLLERQGDGWVPFTTFEQCKWVS